MLRRVSTAFCLLCVLAALPSSSGAQPATPARLIITVVDPTRLVIPGATVTVVGIDAATQKKTIPAVRSSDKGVATFDGLAPGRYSVHGEFPGFELGAIGEIRIKPGDNKHVLLLPLAKMTESITVGRDRQMVASDRGATFGSALTREQIDALSDDADEMSRQLQGMAGQGAAIRVDSFEGQQLPPKAQIKAIHITRDMFAAENHSAGGMFIDIITQPGIGPLRGSARFGFFDSAMDGSNALIPKTGPAQNLNFSLNASGSLLKEKSSFNVSYYGNNGYTTPNLYAATPIGTVATNARLQALNDNYTILGSIDYALTQDQTLRVNVYRYASELRNQGVGAYDLLERAYSTQSSTTTLRLQEAGPIGRRFFINTRMLLNWNDSTTSSSVEAPTIRVNDAFTTGGAQRSGGRNAHTLSLQSDLDYVRGIHSWRTGLSFDGGHYRSDDQYNYLGTYTFASLEAYEAGLPRTYTRRIGDPNIDYWNLQAAWYAQDDIRVSKKLTLSPGIRIEAQTHLAYRNSFGPRFGITWSPWTSGKTTLRASIGRFYDWLSANTYEQTLRVDGFRQRELNIANPNYPDPGALGLVPPTNQYRLGGDVRMSDYTRLSFGVDQRLTKTTQITAVYANNRTGNLLVGDNLNAPVAGVPPYPMFANIIETVSAGEARSQSLSTTLNMNFASLAMGPATTGPRWSWRRGLMVYAGYTLGKVRNNVDGAFIVPASGRLDTEWGPSGGDVRHMGFFAFYTTALKNLTAMLTVQASTGAPYTIFTGYDDNRDLMFNDRPAGVGRNTQRADGRLYSNANFSYTIGLGKKKIAGGQGISIMPSASGLQATTMNMGDQARYRLVFGLNVSNITNHASYINYNGNMTSPLFLKPTAVQGVRRFNLNASVTF